MATTTRRAPVLPPPPGRAGFGGTLRSEFTKIGSVRSTYWTLLILFAVSVGIGAAISTVVTGGWSQPPPPPPAPPDVYEATQVSLAGLLILGQLVIVVPGTLVLSAEYSTGMIRTSLIAMPRRIVIYVAKAVAFAAVALAVALATAFIAFFLGQSLLASSHHSATLAGPGVLRAVIGSALYITLCGLFAFAAAAIIRNTAGTITAMIGLLVLGPLVIVVLGALVLSAEYSTGMIRTSLIAMPRRGVLYVAKAVAFGAVALVVSLATAFTAFFLGQALLASTHQSATLAGPGVLRAVLGSALYITLCGLFAFGAAAVIRNTAATITAMIGLLFVLPVLVNVLPWRDDLVRWLPTSAARGISATVWNAGPQNSHLFSSWGQFAVFAVYTVVLLVVGGILVRKRDT